MSIDAARRYLDETAQRELDDLRAALDVRLAALEAALANPNPKTSLANLVLDLARVATAEAEAAAARASLAAQVDAHQRAATGADAQHSLEAERSANRALRLEIEQVQKTLKAESEGAARLRQQIEELRGAHDSARAADSGRSRELEHARAALMAEQDAGAS